MRKSIKKVSLLLAISFIMTAVFAGCGAKNETAGSSETTTTQTSQASTSEAAKEELKQVDLTWYFIGNGQAKDADLVNAEASKYLKDKINANFKLIQLDWNSYDTKLNAMAAAGEAFDIMTSNSWAFNYRANASKGALLPLEELLEKYGKGTKEVLGEDTINGVRVAGKVYNLPINKEKAHNYGLVFHKGLVDKYKMDLSTIKKPEDIEPLLQIIKENEPGIYPLYGGANPGSSLTNLLDFDPIGGDGKIPGALYGNNDPSNIKVLNQFETPEFKEMLALLRKFYKAGYIRKDAAQQKDDTSNAEGKVFCQPLALKPGKDLETSNSKVTWTQVELTTPTMSTADLTNSMIGISATSDNPERAMMLIELMYTDKVFNNLVNFGIEGTHYTKIDENTIEPVANSGYEAYIGFQWQLGNQFLNYLRKTEDPKKWEKFEEFNKNALPLRSLGFVFDPANVKTELANITNVSDQYLSMLCTGAVDPDVTLPKYTAQLKKAGLDKFLADIQTQYDEFLKNTAK